MSEALVLAGVELQVGADPLAILPAGSALPPSAIMHLTRATLVCEAGAPASSTTQFLVIAQPSEDQEVVITSLSSPHSLSSALELVFHADSSPTFSVRSMPVLKDSSKYTVHLSGYVEVQDEADEEELDEEELKELLAARKKLGLDEDEDEEEEEAEEDEEEEDENEEEDEEEQEGESAAPQKAVSASTPSKRPTKSISATKQSATKTPVSAQTPEKKRKRATDEDNEEEEESQQHDEADAIAKPVNGDTSFSKKSPAKKQHSGTETGSTTKSSPTTSQAVKRFPNGLEYIDQQIGSGESAFDGRKISIRYRGELPSGQVFDSNMPKGQPFSFTLGAGECIKGFDLGIVGMKVGGKRVITIPPALGYGKKGSPPKIPPNTTLKFTVELLKA